jgi:two-component system NtrC family sensor kinase
MLEAHEAERASQPGSALEDRSRLDALAAEIDLPYIRDNLDGLLSRTKDGLDRVTRIIQSLRGHARIAPVHRQEVSVADLFETGFEIIQTQLRGRKIQVERNYHNPPKIHCVFTDINQLVRNLLINACQALEAMPPGHAGIIRVTIRPDGEELRVEVADNGCGIPAADLPRLFDPFFTTKDVREGSGLGLWISHGIVAAHGGRIEVDSRPGQGTTFRVFLPK